MRRLTVDNPANRFAETEVVYLDELGEEETPGAKLEVYFDRTGTILAKNDSPDVGFNFSVNPYRGCFHACAYCLDGDTPILMGDATARALRDVRPGNIIYGTEKRGPYRRYVRTRVLAHWQTVKPAYRIRLADGTELVASGDHRFLTERGWKYVTAEDAHARRPHLTVDDRLLGVSALTADHSREEQPKARLARRHLSDAIVKPRAIPTTRQGDFAGRAVKAPPRLQIVGIEKLGFDMLMFDITTGTGDFIANGVVSHNCYARPTHEYLSFGAGTDFERKIVVKKDAPELLRKSFSQKGWRGELVMFSGVTDCYQPLESRYRLTRGCLEVCAEYKNPAHIITKSPLVERDIDVLLAVAKASHFSIAISIPFIDETYARALEPFVTTPARRLRTIERLAAAGVRVGVMVAPIIPGLNDEDMPAALKAARDAGASFAGYTLLRLPGHVKDVFESRIRGVLPEKAERVMSHMKQARNGKVYDATFGVRGRGTGPYAEAIARLFDATAKRLGFESPGGREEGASGIAMAPIPTIAPRGQLPLFPT